MTSAITLKGIGKRYKIYPSRQEQLKEILGFGKKEKRSHDFWALQDVNLEVERGTTLGILGRNGAGKSTLLKIISGVVQPTTGTVEINGRLAAIFGVGAGFNPEFTGRDNVMLNGLLLGIDRNEMLERFDEIVAFADIGEFIDQPIKTYSSGMRARLGFAVAVNVEPDILVIDETLSVGDAVFKQMGLQKMRDLRDAGTTILFVSHSMGMVKNFCSEAVLLHKGRMVMSGDIAETTDRYEALISSVRAKKNLKFTEEDQNLEQELDNEEAEDAQKPKQPVFEEDTTLSSKKVQSFRHGTGEVRVRNVEILDEFLQPTDKVASGAAITVRMHLEYLEAVEGSLLRMSLRSEAGLDMFSTNTNREKAPLGARSAGERVVVDFTFDVPFKPGNYSVTAAVSPRRDPRIYLDWIDVATVLKIDRADDQRTIQGMVHLPAKVEVHDQDPQDDGQLDRLA